MRDVQTVLQSAVEGVRISPDEAILVFEKGDLLDIADTADRIRQRRHPDNVISYIIDRNINYTNVCKEFCTFCALPPIGSTRSANRSTGQAMGSRSACIQGSSRPSTKCSRG